MTFIVTFPERLRSDIEDRPQDLSTAHPDGFVEVEAETEAKARKWALRCLGPVFADVRDDKDFLPEMYPEGCLARIWKDGKTGVEMEAVL